MTDSQLQQYSKCKCAISAPVCLVQKSFAAGQLAWERLTQEWSVEQSNWMALCGSLHPYFVEDTLRPAWLGPQVRTCAEFIFSLIRFSVYQSLDEQYHWGSCRLYLLYLLMQWLPLSVPLWRPLESQAYLSYLHISIQQHMMFDANSKRSQQHSMSWDMPSCCIV